MLKRALHLTYRTSRRIVILVIGGTVVLIGVIMIVTPGPATLVIPAGLAILSIEFAWARRWLRIMKEKSKQAIDQVRGKGEQGNPPTD